MFGTKSKPPYLQSSFAKTCFTFCFLLVMGFFPACSGRGCQGSQSRHSSTQTPQKKSKSCQLTKILGVAPKVGRACRYHQQCVRSSKGRLAWARCAYGVCLLAQGSPEKAHQAGVLALAFVSKDHLVSGAKDGEIRIWDLRTGKTVQRWLAHKKGVLTVTSYAKKYLFTAGVDQVIRMWELSHKGKNLEKRRLVKRWEVKGRISRIAISPDGKWLAAASSKRKIWFGAVESDDLVTWSGHQDVVRSVVFSPDGNLLLSASDDRSIGLWAVPLGRLKARLWGHEGWVRRAIFSKGSKTRVISASFDQTIRIWDTSGTCLEQWGRSVDTFRGVVKSKVPKGKMLRPQKHRTKGHKSDVSDLAMDTKGRWLLSTGHRGSPLEPSDDGMTARLWQWPSGKLACHLKGHVLGLSGGAFSPDGTLFATASLDGTIRVYRVGH